MPDLPLVARLRARTIVRCGVLALGLIPATALAHAFLVRAVPAAGSVSATAPRAITLFYTEAIVPRFCRVRLDGPRGPVALGPARAVPGARRELRVVLPRLAPGRYELSWQAVSTDTHRTHGRFGFSIAPSP